MIKRLLSWINRRLGIVATGDTNARLARLDDELRDRGR